MKALCTTMIDGFEIVCGLGVPVLDPAGSKRRARERLGPSATYSEVFAEMHKNPEYFDTIPGQKNISDEDGAEFEERLRCLRENERLTRAGEIVCDNRGREWFSFYDGKWSGGTIQTIGETLPDGAVWARDLSRGQVREVRRQEEQAQIAEMSLESRRRAADSERKQAMDKAVRMRLEAEITGESEALQNVKSWYKSELESIHHKYGLPDACEKSNEC